MKLPYKVKDLQTVQKNFDYLAGAITPIHVDIARAAAFTHTLSGGFQKLPFDTLVAQEGGQGQFNSTQGNAVCIKSGLYLILAQAYFNPTATANSNRALQIVVAGNVILQSEVIANPNNFSGAAIWGYKPQRLKVGQAIEAYIYQNTGGNLAYSPGPHTCFLTVTRIGP